MIYYSHSERETEMLGAKLAERVSVGDVVALTGELGAGKTAFVRGFCAKLGISDVCSPTFALVNEYPGKATVYHFDAYRIGEDDWYFLGFDELLGGEGICIIEWAENAPVPPRAVRVTIKGGGEEVREIEIT